MNKPRTRASSRKNTRNVQIKATTPNKHKPNKVLPVTPIKAKRTVRRTPQSNKRQQLAAKNQLKQKTKPKPRSKTKPKTTEVTEKVDEKVDEKEDVEQPEQPEQSEQSEQEAEKIELEQITQVDDNNDDNDVQTLPVTATETETETDEKNTNQEDMETVEVNNNDDTEIQEKPSISERNAAMVSITELKAKCRDLKIKGYSKKTKSEIIKMLIDAYPDNEDIQRTALLVKNVKHLKVICNKLGIRGYSKNKKSELVDIICNTRLRKKELSDQLDQLLEESKLPDYLLTKTILTVCYELIETKKMSLSLQECMNYISSNFEEIQQDFVKILYKRIKKQIKNDDDKENV